MTKSKKILLSLIGIFSLVAISTSAVSCFGNSAKKEANPLLNFNGKVKIAIEKSWESIVQKAISMLDKEEQEKIQVVQLENGSAGSYIDNNIVKDPSEAADIFPTALDKFDSLVSKGSLFEVKKEDLEQYGDNAKLVEINGKYWGYPLNVESLFTIYNTDKYPNGIKKIDDILIEHPHKSKFAAQFNNMWYGAIFSNTLFAQKDKDVSKQWVGDQSATSSPMLYNPKFKKLMEQLYNYNQALKNAGGELQKIATNNNRDEAIRQGIADGSIKGTIDGPWVVQEVISRIMKTHENNKPKAVEMLKKLKAAKLPMFEYNNLKHFKGGWAFSINKSALLKGNDFNKALNKLQLASKFTSLLTSAQFASDWFAQGGKISGAKGAMPKVAAEDMKLQIPGAAQDMIHDMKVWVEVPGFKEAVESFFSETLKAVAEQSGYNVKQPIWPGSGFWSAWDEHGLSSSFKDFNEFWNKFSQEVNLAYEAKNKEMMPQMEDKKPEVMDDKKDEKKPEVMSENKPQMDDKKDEKKPEVKEEDKMQMGSKPEAKMEEEKLNYSW